MNSDRLLLLADYLEGSGKFLGNGVPKHKFDLHLWMAPYNKFDESFYDKNGDYLYATKSESFDVKHSIESISLDIVAPVDCQTAGCAVGWAASMQEFNELGLYLIQSYNEASPVYFLNNDLNENPYYAFSALEIFFDVDIDTIYLFFTKDYYNDYRDPTLVAKRIRKYVESNGNVTPEILMEIDNVEN